MVGRGLLSAKCAEEVAPVPLLDRCATQYDPRAKSTLLTRPRPTMEPPRYPRVDMVPRPALVPSCTRLCRFPGQEAAFGAQRALASRFRGGRGGLCGRGKRAVRLLQAVGVGLEHVGSGQTRSVHQPAPWERRRDNSVQRVG